MNNINNPIPEISNRELLVFHQKVTNDLDDLIKKMETLSQETKRLHECVSRPTLGERIFYPKNWPISLIGATILALIGSIAARLIFPTSDSKNTDPKPEKRA